MSVRRLRDEIDSYLRWALVVLMAGMVINVLWQVFTRFILQDPSSYTDELARYMLVWVGLLGAAYVAGQKMHLAIDLISRSCEGKKKLALEIFSDSCILMFSLVVMVIGGIRLVYITLSLEQISAALQIPLGYVYTVLPLSGVLLVFYSTLSLIERFRQWREISST
jgi:TRAP-type C4-dicarboxylate transport system permease small subunit